MANHQSEQMPEPAKQRIVRTPSETARRAFFCLYECGSTDAGLTSEGQESAAFLFAAVHSGRGCIEYDGRQYTPEAGDFLFLDCRRPFSCRSDADKPWSVSWICFGGCTSAEYYQLYAAQMPPVFRPPSAARFEAKLRELTRLCGENGSDTEILISGMLAGLLTDLLTVNSAANEPESGLQSKLKTVSEYIEANFTQDICLDDLADRFHISKYYLTREFKRVYGESVFRHILSLRIHYAKRLLRFTDKPVEEIAALCGFNDQSYFSKQFKKAEGVTCLMFRRRWRS